MKLVLSVLLFGCVVVYTKADCSPLEAFKVKHQWTEAFATGHKRIDFGLNLWNKFFHDHPESRPVFKDYNSNNIYSPVFEAYSMRVLGYIDAAIGLLDDEETFKVFEAYLHDRIKAKSITPEVFTFFEHALLETLDDYLHSRLDFDAWTHCIEHIIEHIIK